MIETQKSTAHEIPIRPKLGARGAADFCGVSASMLNKLRVTGGGPTFSKLGRRCVYDINDLEEWVASRKRRHTSEDSSTRI
ncbi:MAG: helix-turn-helix transcriptional regulator [Steroidobacteraceae bacterium]